MRKVNNVHEMSFLEVLISNHVSREKIDEIRLAFQNDFNTVAQLICSANFPVKSCLLVIAISATDKTSNRRSSNRQLNA